MGDDETARRRRIRAARASGRDGDSDRDRVAETAMPVAAGGAAPAPGATPTLHRRRSPWLALILVVTAALAIGGLAARGGGRAAGAPPDAPGAPIVISAVRSDLPAGTTVQVHVRTRPAHQESVFWSGPYTLGFTASTAAPAVAGSGGSGVTRQQLEAGLAQLRLPGKVVEAWLVRPAVGSVADGARNASGLETVRWIDDFGVDERGQALVLLDVVTWAPGDPEPDCRAQSECAFWGRCTARQGACVAASDADCAASNVCKSMGDCAVVEAACAPTREEHCSASRFCQEQGVCAFDRGRCTKR